MRGASIALPAIEPKVSAQKDYRTAVTLPCKCPMVRDGDGAGNFFHANDSAILNYDTVFININNVCPVGEGDFYSVTEGGAISVPTILGVLSNDKDDNTALGTIGLKPKIVH